MPPVPMGCVPAILIGDGIEETGPGNGIAAIAIGCVEGHVAIGVSDAAEPVEADRGITGAGG